MKILKIGVILGILASTAMGALWMLDVVQGPEASEALKRILGVIVLLTASGAAIVLISGGKKSN